MKHYILHICIKSTQQLCYAGFHLSFMWLAFESEYIILHNSLLSAVSTHL